MKLVYQKPQLNLVNMVPVALAQTGQNQVPSNPTYSCLDVSCLAQSDGHDTFNIEVSWDDDPGTNPSSYTVNLHVEPENEDYALQNGNPAECQITEGPAGRYTLICSNAPMASSNGNSCDCGNNDFQVVSISDGTEKLDISSGSGTCVVDGTGNPCF